MDKDLKQYRIVAKVILNIDSYSTNEAEEEACEELENGLPSMVDYDIKDVDEY